MLPMNMPMKPMPQGAKGNKLRLKQVTLIRDARSMLEQAAKDLSGTDMEAIVNEAVRAVAKAHQLAAEKIQMERPGKYD